MKTMGQKTDKFIVWMLKYATPPAVLLNITTIVAVIILNIFGKKHKPTNSEVIDVACRQVENNGFKIIKIEGVK